MTALTDGLNEAASAGSIRECLSLALSAIAARLVVVLEHHPDQGGVLRELELELTAAARQLHPDVAAVSDVSDVEDEAVDHPTRRGRRGR